MSNHEAHPAYVALQDDLDAATTELAAVKAELAEANAVIDRVRDVRDRLARRAEGQTYQSRYLTGRRQAFGEARKALDEVEGL